MVRIVWEFHVREGCREEFEFLYNGEGLWVGLFRDDPQYHGTELLRDSADASLRYVTIDRWTDHASFLRFRENNRKLYDALDAKCRHLTTDERLVGVFQEV